MKASPKLASLKLSAAHKRILSNAVKTPAGKRKVTLEKGAGKQAPTPYLGKATEKKIATACADCAEAGTPITRDDIIEIALLEYLPKRKFMPTPGRRGADKLTPVDVGRKNFDFLREHRYARADGTLTPRGVTFFLRLLKEGDRPQSPRRAKRGTKSK